MRKIIPFTVYTYKETVSIPLISYVDDVLTLSECGNKDAVNNDVVNAFTEGKKLKYGTDKCNKIHIEEEKQHLPKKYENYFGEIISNSGK